MAQAYLSLGSNQDAETHLARAARELRERFGALRLAAGQHEGPEVRVVPRWDMAGLAPV